MAKKNPQVVCIVDRFLMAHDGGKMTESTFRFYRQYLRLFKKSWGHTTVDKITPSLASEWVQRHYGDKSPSSQFNAGRAVCRMFHWALAERLIDFYPLAGYRKQSPTRREACATSAEYAAILKACDDRSLRDVVKFVYHTGCRPQELKVIRAEFVQGRKIVLPVALSKGKKRSRVIYLDDMAAAIVARLAKKYPTGELFRTRKGKAWNKQSLCHAFRRLRLATGIKGLCCYSLRHSFITRQLERGTDVATVAALAGNTPQIIFKHYSHVSENENRLLAVLA